jgi:hypothetical protein
MLIIHYRLVGKFLALDVRIKGLRSKMPFAETTIMCAIRIMNGKYIRSKFQNKHRNMHVLPIAADALQSHCFDFQFSPTLSQALLIFKLCSNTATPLTLKLQFELENLRGHVVSRVVGYIMWWV